jgi:hypothetical protein
MSFDINEPVFDEQGSYLEEKALRYEQALMDQFAASRSVTSDYPDGNRTGLGQGDDPLCCRLSWRDPPTMTTSDLEAVVYDLFPRHPSSRSEGTGQRLSKNYAPSGTL